MIRNPDALRNMYIYYLKAMNNLLIIFKMVSGLYAASLGVIELLTVAHSE